MSGRERIHMLAVTWKKFSFQQMEKNFKIGFLINKSEWAMEFFPKETTIGYLTPQEAASKMHPEWQWGF